MHTPCKDLRNCLNFTIILTQECHGQIKIWDFIHFCENHGGRLMHQRTLYLPNGLVPESELPISALLISKRLSLVLSDIKQARNRGEK